MAKINEFQIGKGLLDNILSNGIAQINQINTPQLPQPINDGSADVQRIVWAEPKQPDPTKLQALPPKTGGWGAVS